MTTLNDWMMRWVATSNTNANIANQLAHPLLSLCQQPNFTSTYHWLMPIKHTSEMLAVVAAYNKEKRALVYVDFNFADLGLQL